MYNRYQIQYNDIQYNDSKYDDSKYDDSKYDDSKYDDSKVAFRIRRTWALQCQVSNRFSFFN